MAVTFDAASTVNSGAVTTQTWSHTCSGANRYLLVSVGANGQDATGVTYAGVAMSSLGTQQESATGYRVTLWGLVAPALGANNIVVTFPIALANECKGASFNGVEPTNPTGTVVLGQNPAGTTATATLVVSSTATELVVDSFVWNQNSFPAAASPGAQQTLIGAGAGNFVRNAMSYESGSVSVAMSWTCTAATNWAIAGVPLRPTGIGGGGGSAASTIVFASATNAEFGAAGTAITCSAPAGIANGDFLLAMMVWTSGSETINAVPTNWVSIGTIATGAANKVSTALYYHSASAAEVASYTWGLTGTGVPRSISIWRITGTLSPASSAIDATSGTSGAGASVVGPSATTLFNNEMVIFIAGVNSNGTGETFSIPTGFNLHTNLIANSNNSLLGVEKTQAGAGPTGTVTTNVTNVISTDPWAAQIVTLRPTPSVVDLRQDGSFCVPQSMHFYTQRRWPMSFVGFMMKDVAPDVLLPSAVFAHTVLPIEFTVPTYAEQNPLPWVHGPRQADGPFVPWVPDPWNPSPGPSPSPTPSPSPSPTPNPSPTPGSIVSTGIAPRISLPPQTQPDNPEQWQRQSAAWMAEANQGHLQNTGIITLLPNANNTVVLDDRAGTDTFISFMPRTAEAAIEVSAGIMYVSSQGKKTFTITHSNNGNTGRTFVYTLLG